MLNKHVWNQLENLRNLSSGLVVLRFHPQSNFNVFAALDKSTGHRFLLLKSNRADAQPVQTLPSGRGFTVQFVVTASDPEGAYCLQLILMDPAHSDVFDVIGNDVLKSIVRSADDKAAFSAFVMRIAEWQRFLDQLPASGLSEPAQQGLFAELWFLREVLLRVVSPDKAVHAWAGPKALTKDFQFPQVAIEVKASSTKQPNRFSVSSELQLDTQGAGKLILFCLLLERLVDGGLSLPELVKAVRVNLQSRPDLLCRFSELLLQAGYVDADSGHYTTRFGFRSQHYFEVRDNFPRIVEKDLRPGVGDVHYSILLSECERYALTEEEARNAIRAGLL